MGIQYEPMRGDRVEAYDDVECTILRGTVVGPSHAGGVLIRWDQELYDPGSRGHIIEPVDYILLTKIGTVSRWVIDGIDPRGADSARGGA